MLKKSIFIYAFSFLFVQLSFAVTYQFYDGCNSRALVGGDLSFNIKNYTVGEVTIHLMKKHHIPYIGSDEGINSFFNSPIGLNALEAVSDTKLRAYGPCFIVDGEMKNIMPDKVKFKSNSSHLIWFLGYATYDEGVWTDYCVPSHQLKSDFICDKKE